MAPVRSTNALRAQRLNTDLIWQLRADYAVWKYHRMSRSSPARAALREGGPPSSPRLPSPPPLPELQLGPRSPGPGSDLNLTNTDSDEGADRRVRPGTSAFEMAKGPPFVELHQLESPFQLQEYLKSAYISKTRDESALLVRPITKETAMELATPPVQQDTGEAVDRNLWLYELCRFLVQRTNRVIVSFFSDAPPCSAQTCPEMRASEWQYLCAVHEPPKSCCAIDYCCHTLDWAANVLTSTKHFPSRLSLGGEGASAYQSMRQLTNIFRRVYRIYAHAWFQHREAFWMVEQEEGLFKFFKTVCDAYNLIPEDNYTIPPEAEGDREDTVEADTPVSDKGVSILRNDTPVNQVTNVQENAQIPSQTAQRRHRHTPSTGTSVNPIAEGAEEEEEEVTQISQAVLAEATATSTHTRSPRPEGLSLPDPGPQIPAPEDPTPTPERHTSDPFSEPSSIMAVQEANAAPTVTEEEIEDPTTATNVKPPPSTLSEPVNVQQPSKIVPPLQTGTPPPFKEDEEVRSPSGGSIRTIGNDILSGVLAHMDEGDSEATSTQDSSAPGSKASSESSWSVVGNEVENKEGKKEGQDEGEEDEEMGEIKLDRVATAVKDPDMEEENKEEKNKEHVRDDGTTEQGTPAGVA